MTMTDKNAGYIKIDRKILEWRWARHPNTAWMFITLLLMANYQDHDFENITVHRGQVATSIARLAEKTGTSYAQARRTLTNMVSTGELTITRYSRFLVITIVNYNEYQGAHNHLTNTCKSFSNHLQNISQQSKKDNKEKKEKKGKNIPPKPPSGGQSPSGSPERGTELWKAKAHVLLDRDSGTVDDIPDDYRAVFKTWQEYYDWRNQ